jgi:hypothetical protein
MTHHDWLHSDEANAAGFEAARGAVIGAVKWGALVALVGAGAYVKSPVYRNTTIQFKVFLQSSAMVAGGIIEADSTLRRHEAQVRARKRLLRDQAKWQQYEEELMATSQRDK